MPHHLMIEKTDTSRYARVFALDTQMVFEACPLDQLDWSSHSAGPILLVILPQVSAEVDAKKRDGRLGKRARDLNRLLESSIDFGSPTTVVKAPVSVDIAYVAAGPINWSLLQDLDQNNGDDCIVAQTLHAWVDEVARVELMSFDSRPRAAAKRHGVKAVKPGESWLLDLEPTPADRRIAELEQRIQVLKTTQPELCVTIKMLCDLPISRYHLEALPTATVEPITRMILAKNPRHRTGSYMVSGLRDNQNYSEEYDTYAENLVTVDIPYLHLGVGRFFSQYGLQVTITNSGLITAEHVVVEFRSGNAVLHEGPYLVDVFGPPPPSTQSDLLDKLQRNSSYFLRTDRASFDLVEPKDNEVQIEYRCEDFRHGRSQVLTGVIEPISQTGKTAQIELRVTASNMRGDVIQRLMVPVTVVEPPLAELIDFDHLQFRQFPSVRDLLVPMLKDNPDEIVHFCNDGSRRE